MRYCIIFMSLHFCMRIPVSVHFYLFNVLFSSSCNVFFTTVFRPRTSCWWAAIPLLLDHILYYISLNDTCARFIRISFNSDAAFDLIHTQPVLFFISPGLWVLIASKFFQRTGSVYIPIRFPHNCASHIFWFIISWKANKALHKAFRLSLIFDMHWRVSENFWNSFRQHEQLLSCSQVY